MPKDTVTFSTVRPGKNSTEIETTEEPRLEDEGQEDEREKGDLEHVLAKASPDGILVVIKYSGEKEQRTEVMSWGEAADYVARCMDKANEVPPEMQTPSAFEAKRAMHMAETAKRLGHRYPKIPAPSKKGKY